MRKKDKKQEQIEIVHDVSKYTQEQLKLLTKHNLEQKDKIVFKIDKKYADELQELCKYTEKGKAITKSSTTLTTRDGEKHFHLGWTAKKAYCNKKNISEAVVKEIEEYKKAKKEKKELLAISKKIEEAIAEKNKEIGEGWNFRHRTVNNGFITSFRIDREETKSSGYKNVTTKMRSDECELENYEDLLAKIKSFDVKKFVADCEREELEEELENLKEELADARETIAEQKQKIKTLREDLEKQALKRVFDHADTISETVYEDDYEHSHNLEHCPSYDELFKIVRDKSLAEDLEIVGAIIAEGGQYNHEILLKTSDCDADELVKVFEV